MNPTLLLLAAVCLGLAGCGRQEQNQREVLGKLDAIQAKLASPPEPRLRWATASRQKIGMVIFKHYQAQNEAAKKAEALPPEVEAQVSRYEALKKEMMEKPMRLGLPSRLYLPHRTLPGEPEKPAPEPSAAEKEMEALTKRVEEAKAPVAEIVSRREREAAKLYAQYSAESVVAEYAKGRYDLVADPGDGYTSGLLYHTAGEVTDITEGVIAFFKEKTKQ